MTRNAGAALHDAYAADYDAQVRSCDCHIADLLFGLAYEFARPGQRLLDVGTGSGLAAEPFARAGLEVHGMDFSPAMLEICRAKGFAAGLKEHDVRETPWPYPTGSFEHVISCGVFHFIAELEAVFAEVVRVLVEGGTFAFTTRAAAPGDHGGHPYDREKVGDFEIFSHVPAYIDSLLADHSMARRKVQRCCVGADLFVLWVAQRA